MTQKANLEDLLDSAGDLATAGEFEPAREKFLAVLEIDPEEETALYGDVFTLRKLRRFPEAGDALERALGKHPGDERLLRERAYLHFDREEYAEAVEAFDRALESDPGNEQAVAHKIASLRLKKDLQAAEEVLQQALSLNPESPSLLKEQAWLHYDRGEFGRAIEVFDRILEDHPEDEDALKWKVASLRGEKEFQAAEEVLEQALALNPESTALVKEQAWLHYDRGEFGRAIEVFDRILEDHPEDEDALKWKVASLRGKKEFQAADEIVQEALVGQPTDVKLLRERGLLLYEWQRYEPALDCFSKISEQQPRDFDSRAQAGRTLVHLNRYREAARLASELEDTSDRARFLNSLGDVFRAQSRPQIALEQYRKASELEQLPEYENNVALAFFDLGRYEDAVRNHRELVGTLARARLDLAAALWESERLDESIKQYEQTLREAGDREWKECLAQYADRLLRLEDHDRALGLYAELLDLHPHRAAEIQLALASRLSDLRRHDDALAELDKIPSSDPNYRQALSSRAEILLWSVGDNRRAISTLQEAVGLAPSSPEVHRALGVARAQEAEWEAAVLLFRKAIALGDEAEGRRTWGNALLDRNLHEEAADQFRRSLALDPRNNLASHNLAYSLQRSGDYEAAREGWARTRDLHEEAYRQGARREWVGDGYSSELCLYIGSILQDERQLSEARDWYKRGLTHNPRDISLLASLGQINLEMKDDHLLEEAVAFARAWEACEKARMVLARHQKASGHDRAVLDETITVAELLLALEDWPEAQRLLDYVSSHDPDNAAVAADFGVLHAGLMKHQTAIRHLETALGRDPYNAKVASNLAEAYVKMGLKERAEETHRKALRISAVHVESHVGLGEVYTAMGDAGDDEMYPRAVNAFEKGIETADSGLGSERLSKRKRARILYSLGYARVQLFEQEQSRTAASHLRRALKDFQQSRDYAGASPERDKADRAASKIREKLRGFSAEKARERSGVLIILPAAIVFVFAQLAFFWEIPIALSSQYHLALTFGSLLFLIAGLYLPNLLKLKVAGIELEKAPVEQISTPTSLGIRK